jgi:signal transduction histidine kinase
MSGVTTTGTSSTDELRGMWREQQRWWHGAYAVIWGAAALVTLIDDPGAHGRVLTLALLGVMGVAYLLLGVRGLSHYDLRWAVAYQVVSWSALLVIQYVDAGTETWLLFFILFPQMWAMMSARWATVGTLLAIVAFGLVRWAETDFSSEDLLGILLSAVISMSLSLALGLFIHRIITEAETRAETIDELRATQAKLAAVERDRGVHEERERISREIHDTLAQGFTSVVALSRAAQAALARGDAGAAGERLALIEATASDNLDEARLIVAELTPGHLQSRTLGEALERLGVAVTSETGLRADVRVSGQPVPLGGSAEVVILRTAQEALSNVRRHASAAHVDLTLAYDRPDEVVLTVRDDGLGFEPGDARSGFGLDGVQARAAEVGGAVQVLSEPGGGTTLVLVVPR